MSEFDRNAHFKFTKTDQGTQVSYGANVTGTIVKVKGGYAFQPIGSNRLLETYSTIAKVKASL